MRRSVALAIVAVFLLTITSFMVEWEGMAQVRSVAGAPHNVLDDESP